MEGALAAGAAFAFLGLGRGESKGASPPDSATPLSTERIPQPDNEICSWTVFSPVNDQVAFASGMIGEVRLYVSRPGQPQTFDVLWGPNSEFRGIQACAWSPDGTEIAFIVNYGNKEATPKFTKTSICVVDVASGAVREPVVISEVDEQGNKHSIAVSYQKGLAWWGNSCVCVPANDGSVMKFDTHTGQSETLIAAPEGMSISNVALTSSGELRFIKGKNLGPGNGSEFVAGGLGQDGVLHDYENLTQQLGQTFSARLSQDGRFVFVGKRDTSSEGTTVIYKLETHSAVGQIPAVVFYQKDTYAYVPLTVQNENELILIEMVSLAVEGGGSARNPSMRAVKMTLS